MTKTGLNLFDLRPGKVLLDRYEILRPHRDSGIAATFTVEDKQTHERRELQAFPRGMFEDQRQAAEFADRLQAWRNLDSPRFPSVHEVVALDDGSVLYVSDCPNGQSLRAWSQENPRMEQRDLVELACGLLEGLCAAHEHGLVHGDIKPSSIYFDPQSVQGQLVDGGITPAMWAAKHLGTRTALIGTPFYAPIEQFTGDSPDELSDLYNLATVMYEQLTGVLPWSGKGYIEVFQSKMQKTPPKMSVRAPGVEVDPALEAVVSVGLRAERAERHASAESFLRKLRAVELDG